MGPFLLGSLISGAGSLLGSLFGGSAQAKASRETNETNYKIWREQSNLNQVMYARQNQDYKDNWQHQFDSTNEYNTPLAQRQRLEEAGLNPYLAMQGGNSTGVATSPSMGSASYTPANTPTMQTPDYTYIGSGISNAFNTALSVYSQLNATNNSNQMTTSQLGLNKQIEQGMILNNKFKKDTYKFDYETKSLFNEINKLNLQYQKDTLKSRIEQQQHQTSLVKAQSVFESLKVSEQRVLNKWLPKEKGMNYMIMAQQLCNMELDGKIKKVQVRDILAGILLKNSQTSKNYSDISVNNSKIKNLDASTSNIELDTLNTGEDYKQNQLKTKVVYETVDNIIRTINTQQIEQYYLSENESEYQRKVSYGFLKDVHDFSRSTGEVLSNFVGINNLFKGFSK